MLCQVCQDFHVISSQLLTFPSAFLLCLSTAGSPVWSECLFQWCFSHWKVLFVMARHCVSCSVSSTWFSFPDSRSERDHPDSCCVLWCCVRHRVVSVLLLLDLVSSQCHSVQCPLVYAYLLRGTGVVAQYVSPRPPSHNDSDPCRGVVTIVFLALSVTVKACRAVLGNTLSSFSLCR